MLKLNIKCIAKTIVMFSVILLSNVFTVNNSHSTSLAGKIDEWLAPELIDKREQVLDVLADLKKTPRIENPLIGGELSFGYSFNQHTPFEYLCLLYINEFRGGKKEKLPVIDLGCGVGTMSLLTVFAGARIDCVDYKEVAEKANRAIFTQLKNLIGCTAANSKDYYRVFPQSLTTVEDPTWTKTKHQLCICRDVIHFLSEEDLMILAKRVYENIETGGVFAVQAEAPFLDEKVLAFHNSRTGKVLCPGLGVYCKEGNGSGLKIASDPIPFDINGEYKLGKTYAGRLLPNGTVVEPAKYYRIPKNLFTTEDLKTVFEKVGLRLVRAFYMNAVSAVIEDGKLPELGQNAKACAMFVKK